MPEGNKKPLMISFEYPPVSGGISRLCHEVSHGLDMQVLTQGQYEDELKEWRVTKLRPLRELRALQVAAGLSSSYCISGCWYPEGLIATLAYKRPRVIFAHGLEIMPAKRWWKRWPMKILRNYVLSSADLVITNSEYTKKLVHSQVPNANVRALPLAVDPNRFYPKPKVDTSNETLTLLTVSRIFTYKGYETVFRAIAALPEMEKKKISYKIAGTGPHKNQLAKLAQELNISENIHWLGFIAEEKLPELYQSSDLFVMCTQESKDLQVVEGFGLVFLEAQACGIPCIGTNTGGIPDAITDQDGAWMVEQNQHDEVSTILSKILNDPALLKQQAEKARARIEKDYTWESYFVKFKKILSEEGILSAK